MRTRHSTAEPPSAAVTSPNAPVNPAKSPDRVLRSAQPRDDIPSARLHQASTRTSALLLPSTQKDENCAPTAPAPRPRRRRPGDHCRGGLVHHSRQLGLGRSAPPPI